MSGFQNPAQQPDVSAIKAQLGIAIEAGETILKIFTKRLKALEAIRLSLPAHRNVNTGEVVVDYAASAQSTLWSDLPAGPVLEFIESLEEQLRADIHNMGNAVANNKEALRQINSPIQVPGFRPNRLS